MMGLKQLALAVCIAAVVAFKFDSVPAAYAYSASDCARSEDVCYVLDIPEVCIDVDGVTVCVGGVEWDVLGTPNEQ